jgi:hypothetical protein
MLMHHHQKRVVVEKEPTVTVMVTRDDVLATASGCENECDAYE